MNIENDTGILLPALRILLFLLILAACVTYYRLIEGRNLARKSLRKVYEKISMGNQIHLEEFEYSQMLHGKSQETNSYLKIMERLIYSGIRNHLPWINTGMYTLIILGASLIVAAFFLIVCTSAVAGIAAVAVFLAAQHGAITLLMEWNYRRTEKYLIPFMNMIENFSASSDDLLVILENAGSMAGDPVSREVIAGVERARRSGDVYRALRLLQENIEHPHFKRLMANLEKCSRGTADYRKVITGSRGAAERALAARKEIEELYKNGRGEIMIMAGGGCFLLAIMQELTGIKGNLMDTLTADIAGRCILGVLAAVSAASFWFCIFGIRRRR